MKRLLDLEHSVMHFSFKRNVVGYFCSLVLTVLCSLLSMGAAHAQNGTSNITVNITSPVPLPSSIGLNDTVYVGLTASLDSAPKSTDECTSGSPRGWQGTTYGWSGGTFVDSNGAPISPTPTGSTVRLKLQFSSTGTQSVTVNVTSTTNSNCGTLSGSGSKAISVQVVGVNSIQGSPGSLSIGTLYVAQGTTVTFTATPSGGSWPSGKPIWGGVASGTGASTTVTFNLVSSSASSPSVVTATCGNTVSLSVVVYKLVISPPSGQSVNVGQIVNLLASVAPSDLKLSNYQWSIPGTVVHDWTHTAGNPANPPNPPNSPGSLVWPIGNAQLSSQSLSFAWLDGGSSRQVSLSAQVNGASASATSTFNVTKPNYGFSITPGGPVHVIYNTDRGTWDLRDGAYWQTSSDVGVQLAMTGVPASDLPNCAFWQMVTSSTVQIHSTPTADNPTGWQHAIVQDPVNNNVNKAISGSDILDTWDPYLMDTPSTASDTPGVNMTSLDQANLSDSFADYLMYRPSGTEHTQSIWVPMSTSTWSFSGSATKHGVGWASSDLTSSTNPKAATGSSTTSYPGGRGWAWNIQNVTLVNGQ